MADIFISHSSADNDLADAIGQWFARDRKSWSVFLDRHPRDGIVAGQGWQARLQRELQSCRVVLAIVTPSWLGSNWCFTEAVAATFRGKDFVAVLPAPLSEADLESAPPIVHERQRQPLDLATGAGWEDLLHALDRSGLDPDQWFAIPEGVGPYPGFVAFEERDAGVFFGRDHDITQYLDDLNLLRAPDRARALVISGGSGSGKSSLLKAGLIPRLRRQSEWLVLPPCDLSREPVHALWASLREAFRATGVDFSQAPAPPREADALVEVLGDQLRVLEEASGAWLLMPLDQAEVLLADAGQDDGPSEGAVLLDAVGRLLAARTRKVVAVLTIRTEFMPALERALPPALRLQERSLRPIAGLSEIIEKPAARFGIELEEGLTGLMVEETHGAEALPLLAYTLRELYERYGGDNLLNVEEYAALGRVEGAIRRKVHEVFTDPAPSPDEMAAFRRCVVRYLVRADRGAVEGERYLRTAVRREVLPDGATRLIDRLLEARLLVGGGDDTVAIAHERFIADWPDAPLRRWLVEDRADREVIETLKSRLAERRDGGPLLIGKPLLDAKDFVARDPALPGDEPDLYRFIAESDGAERTRQNRRRMVFGGTVAASLVFFAVAVGAILFYLEAEEQTRIANAQRDRALLAQGVRLLERSDAEWARGQHLDAKITACLALGFEGCGRESADEAFKKRFPVLIAAEHEAERAHARRTVLEHPGYRLVWQSPISRHHAAPIEALAYSGSGALLATADEGGTIKLWDTRSGSSLAVLSGHARDVAGVAFAEDAGLLVSGGADRTLRLWSLADGAEIATLWGHGNAITSVDVTASGAYAASGGWDDVKIWDVAQQRELVSLGIDSHNGTTVAFSPAGDILAVSRRFDGPHDIQLFEVPSGRLLRRLEGHDFGTYSIAFSHDGVRVAAAGMTGKVFVWQVDDARRIAALQFPGEVEDLAFASDSGRIALAGGSVGLWDIATDALAWMPPSDGGPVRTVAVSPDGTTLAAAGDSGYVTLWRPESGEISGPTGHVGAVNAVAVSPDGRLIASGGPDGLWLWNLATGRSVAFRRGAIASLAFSEDARWLAAARENGEVDMMNTAVPSEAVRIADAGRPLNGVAFSAGSELLFSAGRTLSAWNVRDRQEKASAEAVGLRDGYSDVAPLPDGERIIAGSARGAQLLTVADLAEAGPRIDWPAERIAVVADGSRVALAGSEDGTIGMVWMHRIAEPVEVEQLEGHGGRVADLAFDPTGELLASASADGTVRLWRNGQTVAIIPVGPTPPTSVAFSPEGSLLVSGRADGAVQLWRLPDDQERLRIDDLPAPLLQARLSPDGRYLATLGRLSTVGYGAFQLWETATGREIAHHTARVPSGSDGGVTRHLAFSADGARVAVGGWRELDLFDTATGSRTEVPLGERNLAGFGFAPDGALVVATREDGEGPLTGLQSIVTEGGEARAIPLDAATPPTLASGVTLPWSHEIGYRLWDTYDLAALNVGEAVREILGSRRTERLYLGPTFDVLGWQGDGLWIWDAADGRVVRRLPSGQLSDDGAHALLPRDAHIDVIDAATGAQVDAYRFDAKDDPEVDDSAAGTVVYSGTRLGLFESAFSVDYTSFLDIAEPGDQGVGWRSTTENLHASAGGRHFSPPPWSVSGGALYVGSEAADGRRLFWRLVAAGSYDGAIRLLATSPLLAAPGAFDEGKSWLLARMLGDELGLDDERFVSIGERVDFEINKTTRARLESLVIGDLVDSGHFAALPAGFLKYLMPELGPNMTASVSERLELEKALTLSRWFEKRMPETAIVLAEAAIATAPTEDRAYARRGYARARAGAFEGAIADFEQAVALAEGADAGGNGRQLATALYDLACGHSLHAQALSTPEESAAATGRALESLSEAVSAGFDDWRHMSDDGDLAAVRAASGFEARLAAWKAGERPD